MDCHILKRRYETTVRCYLKEEKETKGERVLGYRDVFVTIFFFVTNTHTPWGYVTTHVRFLDVIKIELEARSTGLECILTAGDVKFFSATGMSSTFEKRGPTFRGDDRYIIVLPKWVFLEFFTQQVNQYARNKQKVHRITSWFWDFYKKTAL